MKYEIKDDLKINYFVNILIFEPFWTFILYTNLSVHRN